MSTQIEQRSYHGNNETIIKVQTDYISTGEAIDIAKQLQQWADDGGRHHDDDALVHGMAAEQGDEATDEAEDNDAFFTSTGEQDFLKGQGFTILPEGPTRMIRVTVSELKYPDGQPLRIVEDGKTKWFREAKILGPSRFGLSTKPDMVCGVEVASGSIWLETEAALAVKS